jgi:hypothetical protein
MTVRDLKTLMEDVPDETHVVIAFIHRLNVPHPGKFEISNTWHDGSALNIITGASACELTEDFWRENEIEKP